MGIPKWGGGRGKRGAKQLCKGNFHLKFVLLFTSFAALTLRIHQWGSISDAQMLSRHCCTAERAAQLLFSVSELMALAGGSLP